MSMPTQLSYSGIGLVVFAQQFCLPVPSMLLLMTAGALAAQGTGHLNLWLVVLSGVLGCLAADGFWFWLGRRWGSGVVRVVCSFTANPRKSREDSKRIFDTWGLRLLLIAKFIPGLDGVSPPLAGAGGATLRGFLVYDSFGSVLWTGAFVLLGFAFSSQVGTVIGLIEGFGKLLLVVFGVPLLCWVAWRVFLLVRVVRHLRLRRIGPENLVAKMENPDKLVIFDLLDYEAVDGVPGIPGAVRVDPAKMRSVSLPFIPPDLDFVVYCSSRNELVSARVAEALKKNHGINDVWVLEGGLAAWVQSGGAVTLNLPTGEEVAARVGMILPKEVLTPRPLRRLRRKGAARS